MSATDHQDDFKRLINTPPTFPVPNPTTSGWQEPPHPTVSGIRSAALPFEADVVIIGSGITGCSAANTLLAHPSAPGLHVVVLEARNAVSGATGRNGGQLVSDVALRYSSLMAQLGPEKAAQVLRFSESCMERLREVVAGLDDERQKASEFRNVVGALAFHDQVDLDDCKESLKSMQQSLGQTIISYAEIGSQAGTETYRYKDSVGVVEQQPVAALWPYRLVTGIFEGLLKNHGDRFSLETNTPVLSIEHDAGNSSSLPYALETPRGKIRTKTVIHCTNGYTGRLVPGLVGRMFPLKGTMSIQTPGPSFPRLGNQVLWSYRWKPRYIPEIKEWSSGLFYAQQNAHTGDIWIGGESQTLEELLTSDDSTVGGSAGRNLTTVLPKMFRDVEPVELRKIWSGIMGFTSDGHPFIGRLTQSMTGRDGRGEWVAAGYNGHGMDKAWLSGDAIARMFLGEDVSSWVPEAFVLDEARWAEMGVDATVDYFMDLFAPAS
ncbi:FAD dependent oxidoreductase [Thozetella sp. PMI_491]|nr:FAD dependent oxidoreductase [Thozetella sp. PMI_491]